MTGYTVHTGSTEKFSQGWDQIFGGSGKPAKQKKAPASKTASQTPDQETAAPSKDARTSSEGS